MTNRKKTEITKFSKNPMINLALMLLIVGLLSNGCSQKPLTSDSGDTGQMTTALAGQAIAENEGENGAENAAENPENPDEKRFTLTQLQEDFDEIKTTIAYFHPKLYTDEKELEAIIASQYNQLEEGMTAIQFYRVVAPIISASRCGHTHIGLSEQDFSSFMDSAHFLPFSVYWQNNVALVNQNALISQVPIGSQILSIDGVKIEDAIAGMLQNIASDGENQTQKVRAINDGFRYHYAMANPTSDKIRIEYIGPDKSDQRSLVIESVSKSDLESAGDSVWGLMNRLSWENSSRFEKGYALMRMASFYPSGGDTVDSYKTFIDDFFAKVKQDQVQTVVLDVRDNFGGDPNVGAHLLSYLTKKAVPYFDEESGTYYPHLVTPVPLAENRFSGQLFVLINGNCFSTTGHFLALLKYHGIGILIGEETGGSFACSDASNNQSLTHTNLQFKSSRSVFKVVVEGLTPGRGIMPDYPVVANLDDMLSKKDVEMEKALELMRNQ